MAVGIRCAVVKRDMGATAGERADYMVWSSYMRRRSGSEALLPRRVA